MTCVAVLLFYSCCLVLLLLLWSLFRHLQHPLRRTPQAQGGGGAEPPAKTPTRRGASFWSATGRRPLAAGRRGRCGFSLWRRSLRTSTPWTDNYRCSLPPPLSHCMRQQQLPAPGFVLHPNASCGSVCWCARVYHHVYHHVLLSWARVHRLFPSVVMKSLKAIKKSCRVTAAACEPSTSIRPCQ